MPRLPSITCAAVFVTLVGACGIDFEKKSKPPDEGGASAGDATGAAPGRDGGGASGNGDSGNNGTTPIGRPDSGVERLPDGGEIVGPECVTAADCGDPVRLDCVTDRCVEYECYAGKPCTGTDLCESHVCVAFVPPERFPAGFFQSSGGGTTASNQYTLRLSVGMPQPMGVMSSGMYRMTIGPGAGRP